MYLYSIINYYNESNCFRKSMPRARLTVFLASMNENVFSEQPVLIGPQAYWSLASKENTRNDKEHEG